MLSFWIDDAMEGTRLLECKWESSQGVFGLSNRKDEAATPFELGEVRQSAFGG